MAINTIVVNNFIGIFCVLLIVVKLNCAYEEYNLKNSEPQCTEIHQQMALDIDAVSNGSGKCWCSSMITFCNQN